MSLRYPSVFNVVYLINMIYCITSSIAYRKCMHHCRDFKPNTAAMATLLLRLGNSYIIDQPSNHIATNASPYSTTSGTNNSHNLPSSSSSTRITSNNVVSLNPALSPSCSIIGKVYETLDISHLCDATCVIVQSPTPDQFNFYDNNYLSDGNTVNNSNDNGQQQHREHSERHDPHSWGDNPLYKEIEFGKVKEQNNKARLNKFMGGRIALRRAFEQLNTDLKLPIFKGEWGRQYCPRR